MEGVNNMILLGILAGLSSHTHTLCLFETSTNMQQQVVEGLLQKGPTSISLWLELKGY